MAAYAAVVSLMNTIQRLLRSSHISIVSPSREILRSVYEDVKSLKQVLASSDKSRSKSESEGVKALEREMREAVCKLEDVLESHVANQFLSQPDGSLAAGDEDSSLMHSAEAIQEIDCFANLVIKLKSTLIDMLNQGQIVSQSESQPLPFSKDLQELRQDIDCFRRTAKKMELEYIKEFNKPSLPKKDGNAAVSSITDFVGDKSMMVGLYDQFCEIRDELIRHDRFFHDIVLVTGMPGIGKTILAKKIFEDPDILRNFDARAFVKVGQEYQSNKILQAIMAQVNPNSGGRYLIVLDDVWDTDICNDITRRIRELYVAREADICNDTTRKPTMWYKAGRILVTTRLHKFSKHICARSRHIIPFLNKEESWDLLRRKVFVEGGCTPQLEKVGREIAENCEGLPLLILTVANLLREAERTPVHWNEVAGNRQSSIFIEAYVQLLKVLYPSYNYLPQHLKACFLYVGAFPQNCDIRPSKLIQLWDAEGFLEQKQFEGSESFATRCWQELVYSNVVLARKGSLKSSRIKALGLHSVCWYLCKTEAKSNNFLHILSSYADRFLDGKESQRRLSMYKNVLFGIKDVHNSIASISTVRSLICTGPYHRYQVPICFSLRLLRVLDALTIRFYSFPVEVEKLVQLRYLAFTYNGKLPPSISELRNLHYLIVHQHLSIKTTVAESFLPVEIWGLQELKCLQIMGRNLPDSCGAVLPNLLTLLDVGTHSCTTGIFKSIPKLQKLRVQIELAPTAVETLSCFGNICHLHKLESFKCVVMNPKLRSKITAPPLPVSVFVSYLKNLTLSGFGYPWSDMKKIVELPYLEVLKLKAYAFQGEKWEVGEKGFMKLTYLSVDDTDLVRWTVRDKTFPQLRCLTLKNCYKLQEIPEISSLQEIQLVDCKLSAVTCAKKMASHRCKIYANSSWDEGSLR